jgi:hypothetical protein
MRVLNPESTSDLELDHLHYCDECKHWFVCVELSVRCKTSTIHICNHKEHIEPLLSRRVITND